MTFFTFANWFFCLSTSLLLVVSLWRYRYLLVKPSIIVIIFFHLTIQWAATARSAFIESFLPDPFLFMFLGHGFPLIGFLVSFFCGHGAARVVWRRIVNPQPVSARSRRKIIFILGSCIAVIAAYYLSQVPLSRTGLVTILTDPTNSYLTREESLKLIDNAFSRYSYRFLVSVFAPLIAVLLVNQWGWSLKRKHLIESLAITIAIVGILFVVSLTGARSPPAMIVLTILLALFFRKGVPIKPIYIILAAVATLIFPTLFTILREGRELSLSNFWSYLIVDGMFQRVFISPMNTGLWHTHYAQTTGLVGLGGIPKLAVLFGVQPIPVSNLIYLQYGVQYGGGRAIASGTAGTAYVFAYYSYFGVVSFVFSLIGLWLLDLSLWVYRRLSDTLLLPCVAAVSVTSINFLSGDYTTVLLTHGFGVLLIVALLLNRLCCITVRTNSRPTTGIITNSPTLREGTRITG